MSFLFLLILIIIGICAWLIMIYNQLQAYMQNIREQLSNLQAALKKRIDLANQIIDIAKGYGDHEKFTYTTISQSNAALSQMQVLAQNYPQLQANQTYLSLMDKLENIEALILNRREKYNATVRQYNSFRNRFPAILIAAKLSFDIAPYYEIEDPDFMEKVKIFERDDSEALQAFVQNSSRVIGEKLQQTQHQIKHKLDERQEYVKQRRESFENKRQNATDSDEVNNDTANLDSDTSLNNAHTDSESSSVNDKPFDK